VLSNPKHPQFERVDCFLCHRGHDSEHRDLLRSNVVEYEPDNTKGAAPAGPPPDRGQWGLDLPTGVHEESSAAAGGAS
jgi:predicted CXXCH cytochrome family protein